MCVDMAAMPSSSSVPLATRHEPPSQRTRLLTRVDGAHEELRRRRPVGGVDGAPAADAGPAHAAAGDERASRAPDHGPGEAAVRVGQGVGHGRAPGGDGLGAVVEGQRGHGHHVVGPRRAHPVAGAGGEALRRVRLGLRPVAQPALGVRAVVEAPRHVADVAVAVVAAAVAVRGVAWRAPAPRIAGLGGDGVHVLEHDVGVGRVALIVVVLAEERDGDGVVGVGGTDGGARVADDSEGLLILVGLVGHPVRVQGRAVLDGVDQPAHLGQVPARVAHVVHEAHVQPVHAVEGLGRLVDAHEWHHAVDAEAAVHVRLPLSMPHSPSHSA